MLLKCVFFRKYCLTIIQPKVVKCHIWKWVSIQVGEFSVNIQSKECLHTDIRTQIVQQWHEMATLMTSLKVVGSDDHKLNLKIINNVSQK